MPGVVVCHRQCIYIPLKNEKPEIGKLESRDATIHYIAMYHKCRKEDGYVIIEERKNAYM